MHPLFICTGARMGTITKIKMSDDQVTVELDNGESLYMPYQISNLYKLDSGRSIDPTEYRQLKEESQRFQCKRRALDYLAIRIRSAAEMERYLQKKGYAHDTIQDVVRGLIDAGYLDDYDFAARFIDSRLNKKLVGKHLLASELQKRGISRTIIKAAIKESESRHTDIDTIFETARKKYAALKLKKNALTKLAYFLQRRGFDAEIVHTVIERIRSRERE